MVEPVVPNRLLRRTRLSAATVAMAVLCGHALAEQPAATAPAPVWTLVPTRVDRSKQQYVRIEPEDALKDRLTLTPDRPVRMNPGATFNVGGKPVQIFGIDLPEAQKLCETPGGARWACGGRAHAAFAALITSRTLVCDRLSPVGASLMVASCKAGPDDVAERLLRDGWASAAANANVNQKSLETIAQKTHRGIWRTTVPEF